MGTHLPYCSDTIAVPTVNQMKARAYTYCQAPLIGVKNTPSAASDTIVSDPPTQMGLDTQ